MYETNMLTTINASATEADLNKMVDYLNSRRQKRYMLTQAFGGYGLSYLFGENWMDVFSCGHVSNREAYNLIRGYIRGIKEGEQ